MEDSAELLFADPQGLGVLQRCSAPDCSTA
jgi:hypothetical protein